MFTQDPADRLVGAPEKGTEPPLIIFVQEVIGQLAETLANRGGSYADIEDNSNTFCNLMKWQGATFPSMNNTAMHCHVNIMTKLARLGSSGFSHHDSVLDIAGYAILWLADLKRRDWREDSK